MTIPVHSIQIEKERQAVAPYNFVPLPEKMVEAEIPPTQDIFHTDLLTGWIDFEIESCSPVYIRGMYTKEQYTRLGNKKAGDLTSEEKLERAPFYTIQQQPALPGSSLRGMLRELVEIVSSGRMRWVSKSPTFTYRAVADKSDDPLKRKYKDIIGNMASNVRAGYLVFEHGSWYIQPAQTTDKAWFGSKKHFLKVYEEDVDISSFIKMSSSLPKYRPQVIEVSFNQNGWVQKRNDLVKKVQMHNAGIPDPKKHWNEKRACYIVKSKSEKLPYEGWLITSGNMQETGVGTPNRFNHYIFPPVDEKVTRLSIPEQVVDDYRAGLTPYQLEELTDWRDDAHDESWGCLGHGKPVFYIPDKKNANHVQYFGHNPNFRIPVMLSVEGENRAANPLDFVPDFLRDNPNPDMADAIFGWTEEWDEKSVDGQTIRKQIGPAKQHAGRVFFSDAMYVGNNDGIWYNNGEPITPKILSSPKPTTFQHYLIQDKEHDPNRKESLAHYGTPPSQTGIRGYKFYWHKGSDPKIKYDAKDTSKKFPENVLTRITPIKSGVRFTSKIHFENLRPEELGVLCWVVKIQGESKKTYRHKIGMGKPLGMGALKITLNSLHLSLRKDENEKTCGRYAKLIDGNTWFTPPASAKTPEEYILDFENFMRKHKVLNDGQKLSDNVRIQDLLELLRWHGDTVEEKVIEVTRYMGIENDEYTDRPVLPTPKKVFEGWFNEKTDVKKMIEEARKRAANPEIVIPKKAEELNAGDKITCVVTSVENEGKGNVHFVNEKYGENVDFVLPVGERFSQDRFSPNKTRRHHLEVLEVKKDGVDGKKWIVYCKKA